MPEARGRPDRVAVIELAGMGADYNPRKISDGKMRALRASLRKYGHVQVVVVNVRSKKNGWPKTSAPVIVGGHQTVKAAALEKFDELAVRWVDLSKLDEIELNLALNKIDGEWDDEILAPLLAGLASSKEDPGALVASGFSDAEIGSLLARNLGASSGTNGNEVDAAELFGGATSMSRTSAPWIHWKKAKLLKGKTLDFGCGQEDHGGKIARFDAFTVPDVSVLLRSFDTIVCSYVLNTQPADHLSTQILALLSRMLNPGGRLLLAVVSSSKELDGTRAAGGRDTKSREEWELLIGELFDFERAPATGFYGWSCDPKWRT